MRLTPRELDRLTIFSAAELARRRRDRGLKLNHPEATALICDEIMEFARDGNSYQNTLERATQVLRREDVMEGVPELVDPIRVEVSFLEGTKPRLRAEPQSAESGGGRHDTRGGYLRRRGHPLQPGAGRGRHLGGEYVALPSICDLALPLLRGKQALAVSTGARRMASVSTFHQEAVYGGSRGRLWKSGS